MITKYFIFLNFYYYINVFYILYHEKKNKLLNFKRLEQISKTALMAMVRGYQDLRMQMGRFLPFASLPVKKIALETHISP